MLEFSYLATRHSVNEASRRAYAKQIETPVQRTPLVSNTANHLTEPLLLKHTDCSAFHGCVPRPILKGQWFVALH